MAINVFKGFNWDKVNLTLSSGNPSEGAQVSRMNPWYIDVYKDDSMSKGRSKNMPMAMPESESSMVEQANESMDGSGRIESAEMTPHKMEQDAFLQIQLKDWESLNLLPEKSSIFFEGSFVGQGYINTKNAKETLDLSVGRDKKIIVNRENNKQVTSRSEFFGNSASQQYAYTMDVKKYS